MWFTHTTDDARERPDLFQQQDPSVCVTYSGVEAAVDALLARAQDVDCVVGLFEGCIVVHLAAARLLKEGRQLPWPCSVLFGDLPIRDDALRKVFETQKASHQSIHVFGKADEYYFYGRRAAGRLAPEDYYEAESLHVYLIREPSRLHVSCQAPSEIVNYTHTYVYIYTCTYIILKSKKHIIYIYIFSIHVIPSRPS